MNTLLHLYTLLAMTQSRVTNIPLYLLFNVLFKFLAAQDLSLPALTTTSLLLQHASFFAQGGSNAISSIDLSSAYNGVADYNAGVVALLTFVGNWAAPGYWVLATTLLLLRKRKASFLQQTDPKRRPSVWRAHVALLTVFVAAALVAVMAACTALRTHLFIWTVFSPKYLYSMAWSLGQHLAVNVLLGGFLFWAGSFE